MRKILAEIILHSILFSSLSKLRRIQSPIKAVKNTAAEKRKTSFESSSWIPACL
jgi:hypothetical protein